MKSLTKLLVVVTLMSLAGCALHQPGEIDRSNDSLNVGGGPIGNGGNAGNAN